MYSERKIRGQGGINLKGGINIHAYVICKFSQIKINLVIYDGGIYIEVEE